MLVGLTATPEHSSATTTDWLGRAVEWMVRPVVAYRVQRLAHEVEVRLLRHARGAAAELKRYGKPDYTRMVTRLVEDEARTDALTRVARALAAEDGHVIMIFDRRALLEALHARLGDALSGVYAGETTKRRRRRGRYRQEGHAGDDEDGRGRPRRADPERARARDAKLNWRWGASCARAPARRTDR